jgi:hypothetical protein
VVLAATSGVPAYYLACFSEWRWAAYVSSIDPNLKLLD